MSGVLWCSQDLDLSLLLLVFSLIFTVASRLLQLHSTVDKTSPFEDNGLLFWVPDVFCLHSEVFFFSFCGNYSAFKCSFDEFVAEKVASPVYFSAILGPPPLVNFLHATKYDFYYFGLINVFLLPLYLISPSGLFFLQTFV